MITLVTPRYILIVSFGCYAGRTFLAEDMNRTGEALSEMALKMQKKIEAPVEFFDDKPPRRAFQDSPTWRDKRRKP